MIVQKSDFILKRALADGSQMSYAGNPPQTIESFVSAANPVTWRNHHKPFSALIYKPDTQECLLVRDHLGIEPLYYWYEPGKKLIAGDTIASILAHLPTLPALRTQQIHALFSEDTPYSDETIYSGINRVEPGHVLLIRPNQAAIKLTYWALAPAGETIHYRDEEAYLEHFTHLLHEGITSATEEYENIAAEYSAGLDSSAVYCAARAVGLQPRLYMYVDTPGTNSYDKYNVAFEEAFLAYFSLEDAVQRIGPEGFDPIAVFNQYAEWFSGPAPYLYYMFSCNLHKAVAKAQHPILLSGFGGDQCVSGIIPPNFFLPELIRRKDYAQAWRAISPENQPRLTWSHLRRTLNLAYYAHPSVHRAFNTLREWRGTTRNKLLPLSRYKTTRVHPHRQHYFNSLREAEASLITGEHSHEVRMRVEYSGLVSKKMGFQYRYPLLYPPLLEYFLSLPLEQKRKHQSSRLMLRRYVNQALGTPLFDSYLKGEGLGIVPSTFSVYQTRYRNKEYEALFNGLPFAHLMAHGEDSIAMRRAIKGYMLNRGLAERQRQGTQHSVTEGVSQ